MTTWGDVLYAQEMLGPSVHFQVLDHHLESSLAQWGGLICHEWYKEPLYKENDCVPITHSTFQVPQGLSYSHKKYWTHRIIIQFWTTTLNRALALRKVWYAKNDLKNYCTRKMAASQSRTVNSKTHRVCPIRTRNIGPIGQLFSTRPTPWMQLLSCTRSDMPWMI